MATGFCCSWSDKPHFCFILPWFVHNSSHFRSSQDFQGKLEHPHEFPCLDQITWEVLMLWNVVNTFLQSLFSFRDYLFGPCVHQLWNFAALKLGMKSLFFLQNQTCSSAQILDRHSLHHCMLAVRRWKCHDEAIIIQCNSCFCSGCFVRFSVRFHLNWI